MVSLAFVDLFSFATFIHASFFSTEISRYMMTCVALLMFSNTALWIAVAPVSTYADQFFDYTDAATMLSLIYMLLNIPVALPAMFLTRTLGLRFAIVLAGKPTCVSILRVGCSSVIGQIDSIKTNDEM
jgi:hypothetical protein